MDLPTPPRLPVPEPVDDRTAWAQAYAWSAEVISIALESVAPLLLGLWLDRRLGTIVLFLLLGGALGMSLGLWHLIRLTKALRSGSRPGHGRSSPPPEEKSPEDPPS